MKPFKKNFFLKNIQSENIKLEKAASRMNKMASDANLKGNNLGNLFDDFLYQKSENFDGNNYNFVSDEEYEEEEKGEGREEEEDWSFDETINMIMRSNQKVVSKSFKEISCFSSISENDYEESTVLFDYRDIEKNSSISDKKYRIESYKNGMYC